MKSETVDKISGLIGLLIVGTFVLGLAYSISTGFAGFWGGMPFWVISISVLMLTVYDYWKSCLKSKD